MLQQATKQRPWLKCRNLTMTQVDERFGEGRGNLLPRGLLPDCRVDYGIFIVPPETSDLGCRARAYMTVDPVERQLNHLLCFLPDRPLAPGVERADGQLASFGRAQLRLLQEIWNRHANRDRDRHDDPILTQLRVTAVQWELSFLVHESDVAITYGSNDLGNTKTLLGRYRVYRSLLVLFEWAETVACDWWTGHLDLSAVHVFSGVLAL